MYGFNDLRQGTVWEHFHSSIVFEGELIGRYELTRTIQPPKAPADPWIELVNLETGGVAKIYSRALREGPLRKPHPYWELAD